MKLIKGFIPMLPGVLRPAWTLILAVRIWRARQGCGQHLAVPDSRPYADCGAASE
jgi:hypothetical protein